MMGWGMAGTESELTDASWAAREPLLAGNGRRPVGQQRSLPGGGGVWRIRGPRRRTVTEPMALTLLLGRSV